ENQFAVYKIFCGNYERAIQETLKGQANLVPFSHVIDPIIELPSYLIKPVQRICKYPLFLKDLRKLTDIEEFPFASDLLAAQDSVKRVADFMNEQKRKEENAQVKIDLLERVDDWKALNPGDFGDLLIYDKFPMSSSDGKEKDYYVYLFDTILLCFKEVPLERKLVRRSRKDRNGADITSTYFLRGNISIIHISIVIDISKPPQQFGVSVNWKDGNDVENFTLKCRNEEQVRLWKDRLDRLVNEFKKRKSSVNTAPSAVPTTPVIGSLSRNASDNMWSDYEDSTLEDGFGASSFGENSPARPSALSKVFDTANNVMMKGRIRSHSKPDPPTQQFSPVGTPASIYRRPSVYEYNSSVFSSDRGRDSSRQGSSIRSTSAGSQLSDYYGQDVFTPSPMEPMPGYNGSSQSIYGVSQSPSGVLPNMWPSPQGQGQLPSPQPNGFDSLFIF
ncbi:hypothetical protein HK096_005270, partial [Nowakowskiella sp. JEL0078]